ncbi:MAG: hypothetical protein L0Y77_10630 [Chlorobi bacterium]|nr:hypothetical protein [Chlorobiota bacterium]
MDEFDLPLKPVLTVLLMNNLLGVLWTFINGGYQFETIHDTFTIVFSWVSTIAIVIFMFIRKEKKLNIRRGKKSQKETLIKRK